MAGSHKAHHHGKGEHVEHHGRDHGHEIEHHESHHKHPKAEHEYKRARGGKVGNEPLKGVKEYADDEAPEKVYAGKDSNVHKEAEEKKHGGRAKHKHEGGKVEGKMAHMHLGRPGRKKGGRVGSDKSPLSSAAHVTEAGAHDADSGC